MPSLDTLLLFSLACLALTATPGPDMLLIVSRSVSQGGSAGLATLAGIQLGTYCHALATALGLSGLLLAAPAVYDAVRYAGAAYLLWLAGKTLFGKPASQTDSEPAPIPSRRIVLQGPLTNLLNPKMALFVLALFPQFVQAERGGVLVQMMTLASVLNLVGLAVNGVVILLADKMAKRLLRKKAGWPRYLLSGVFVALACRLAWAEGRS